MSSLADLDAAIAAAERKADQVAGLWRAGSDPGLLDEALRQVQQLRQRRMRLELGLDEKFAATMAIERSSPARQPSNLGNYEGLPDPRVEELATRVKALEERPVPDYKGVWQPGRYEPGDMVTSGGSMWYSTAPTEAKPGNGPSTGWVLCVKAGYAKGKR